MNLIDLEGIKPKDRALIVAMHKRGASVGLIAKKMQVSERIVFDVLVEAGEREDDDG